MTQVGRDRAVFNSRQGENSSSFIVCLIWFQFYSRNDLKALISKQNLKIRFEYDLSKKMPFLTKIDQY